jgi:hypothetical protein
MWQGSCITAGMNDTSAAIRRVVLIIVILLAGIGAVWGWTAANKWTKERPVRLFNEEVDNLFEAFHQYRQHVGEYPKGNNAEIAKALLEGNNPKRIVILAVKKAELNAKGEIVDPWGTPLKIYFANNEVIIRSAGPNKQFDDSKSGLVDDYFRSD